MAKPFHGGQIYSDYDIIFADKITDFSANLNPLGMPDEIKKAISEDPEQFSAYPDTECRKLRKAISQKESVSYDHIICGNGADDLIYRFCQAVKPKSVLTVSPSFSEYEEAAKSVGARVEKNIIVERNGYVPDDGYLRQAKYSETNVVFFCNPNNPSGCVKDKEYVEQLIINCRDRGAIAFIDESFMDFVEDNEKYSVTPLVEKYDNLIILKSFTKMFSMAGIRAGYAMTSNTELIEKMNDISQSWAVSTVAQKCGEVACTLSDFEEKTRKYVSVQREYLMNEFAKLSFRVYPSNANFIMVRTTSSRIYERLIPYGILVRRCENYEGLTRFHYRFAVKSEEENRYLIECLNKLDLSFIE